MKLRPRLTNEEIKARLILIVGIAISAAFILTVGTLLYGLLFVTQPLAQAPNDVEAWTILSHLREVSMSLDKCGRVGYFECI